MSRKGICILYFTNWKEHRDFLEQDYDETTFTNETKFFSDSKSMFLFASKKILIFVHLKEAFGKTLSGHVINDIIHHIHKTLTQNCHELLSLNLFNFPEFITKFENIIECNNSEYKTMLTRNLSSFISLISWLKKLGDEKNKDINWDNIELISEITSHGYKHARNLAHLANNLFWDNSPNLKYNMNKIPFFVLLISCWIHDFGLTLLPEKNYENNLKNNFEIKKIHGFKLLDKFKQHNRDDNFLKLFALTSEDEELIQFLRTAILVSAYHQKRSMLIDDNSNNLMDNELDYNPYSTPLPAYSIITYKKVEYRIDIRFICSILRVLDAIDIRQNRTNHYKTEFNKLSKTFSLEYRQKCSTCKKDKCSEQMRKYIERILKEFNEYIEQKFSLMKFKEYEELYKNLNVTIQSITKNKLCEEECIGFLGVLKNFASTPFHYGKHDTFIGVFFDDENTIVYIPKFNKSLEEILYFFRDCSVTSTHKDFLSELTDDSKSILKRNGVSFKGPELFNPLLHGNYLRRFKLESNDIC